MYSVKQRYFSSISDPSYIFCSENTDMTVSETSEQENMLLHAPLLNIPSSLDRLVLPLASLSCMLSKPSLPSIDVPASLTSFICVSASLVLTARGGCWSFMTVS